MSTPRQSCARIAKAIMALPAQIGTWLTSEDKRELDKIQHMMGRWMKRHGYELSPSGGARIMATPLTKEEKEKRKPVPQADYVRDTLQLILGKLPTVTNYGYFDHIQLEVGTLGSRSFEAVSRLQQRLDCEIDLRPNKDGGLSIWMKVPHTGIITPDIWD